MSATIHLGCQGWAYPDWLGSFYPPGAKQEALLPFYAQVFDTVELDNTFYRPPKASIARSWHKHTPPHFRFGSGQPGRQRPGSALNSHSRPWRPVANECCAPAQLSLAVSSAT